MIFFVIFFIEVLWFFFELIKVEECLERNCMIHNHGFSIQFL
jgi:hypothetical protein